MSAPLIILASLPSFSSKLVEIWQSSDKYKFAQFFLRHGVDAAKTIVECHLFDVTSDAVLIPNFNDFFTHFKMCLKFTNFKTRSHECSICV